MTTRIHRTCKVEGKGNANVIGVRVGDLEEAYLFCERCKCAVPHDEADELVEKKEEE